MFQQSINLVHRATEERVRNEQKANSSLERWHHFIQAKDDLDFWESTFGVDMDWPEEEQIFDLETKADT